MLVIAHNITIPSLVKKVLDRGVNKIYMIAMDKTEKHKDFMKLIDQNRKVLRKAGYPDSTVSRWAGGDRIPRAKSAIKLAFILDVSLERIPYHMDVII